MARLLAPDGELVLRIDAQQTPLGVAKLRSQQSMTMCRSSTSAVSGETQPGRVRLCIAQGQTDATLQPEPTRAIFVEGAFEAATAP
jgi:hypothetical protein